MSNMLINTFFELFSQFPKVRSIAPGRVNIIGEHTDYNEGFVLPAALQFHAEVLVSPTQDQQILVHSMQYPKEADTFKLGHTIDVGPYAWSNYIRGIVLELQNRGYKIGGFELLMTSNVPQGSGLSSSAALEVAVIGALNSLFDLGLSRQQIAQIGQATENNFIDCQCGIMDQLISASAVDGHAVKIDCLDLSTEAVAIPENQAFMIINSNYPRKLADSEYNERREACNHAAKIMGISSLRHADLTQLVAVKDELDSVTYRRAKHVITENQRVLDTLEALGNGDITAFYNIMRAGQLSLEKDFEITVSATETLVNICLDAVSGKAGVRQTGGGFGGAIVCVCHNEDVTKIREAVETNYAAQTGLTADIYVCKASQGLHTERFD